MVKVEREKVRGVLPLGVLLVILEVVTVEE